jgi:hypothetical protein
MDDSLLYTPTKAIEVGDLIRRAHHQLMDAEETLDSIKRYFDKTVSPLAWYLRPHLSIVTQALEGILYDIEELTNPSHDEDASPIDCGCLDCVVGILESSEESDHE